MSEQKPITRVRIERGDTFIELTDPEACQRWGDIAAGQAVLAFAHGAQQAPLPWKEGKIDVTCRRCGKVNPAAQKDCPAGVEIPGADTEPHDLVSSETLAACERVADSEFAAGVEAAAKLVELHCCVSTCCDAQPGSGEAEELARCVRKNAGPRVKP